MTNFIAQPNADGLVKLSGTIKNLKATRAEGSFVFTDSDQTKMGVVAIAAAIAGLGGQAIAAASNSSNMDELADYLEFDLGDNKIQGWVWRNPFKEGEIVNVAAEWQDGHHEMFGMARVKDKMIGLYPHCSRGKATHKKNAIKWWFTISTSFFLLVCSLALMIDKKAIFLFYEENILQYGALGIYLFFALMVFSLSRKWMPFVRLAEKVFRALDLPNPSNIDLVKSSKAQRKPDDSNEYGVFYFRY